MNKAAAFRVITVTMTAAIIASLAIGSPAHSATHHTNHSVIVGSTLCESTSQAINDPEDCTPLQSTPDITIATCTTTVIPAYTRTDVCIDASGSVVPRIAH